MSDSRWYHGGANGLRPDELLLPPTVIGVKSQALEVRALRLSTDFNPDLQVALLVHLKRIYQPDRVYVTSDLQAARWYAQDGGSVYEVEPIGDLRLDRGEPSGYTVEAARVIFVVEDDVPVLVSELIRSAALKEQSWGYLTNGPVFTANYFLGWAEKLFCSLLRRLPKLQGVHGELHWRQVLANGFLIAAETPEVDPFVVAAFAALHDACRKCDGHDPDHGERAEQLALELAESDALCLFPQQLDVLCVALRDHDRGYVNDVPTIGACWDADRLDLPRVGVKVDPSFLSTPFALALNQ